MFVDNDLKLNDGDNVRASDPDFSSPFDLTLSPELGVGHECYVVIVVNTYSAGQSGGTTFNIVLSSSETFASGNTIVASKFVSDTNLAARAGDAGLGAGQPQPIILKFQINQEDAGINVQGTGNRYLGVRYDHDSSAPTTMTATAYLTTDFQSSPKHGFFASGSTIL
jgi:hypothetical protein